VAHVGAFFIAWTNSFVFNALWTFEDLKKGQVLRQVFAFLIVGLIGLGLSTLTIYIVGYFVTIYLNGGALGVYGAKIL